MFANTGIPDEKLPKTMQNSKLRELQVNFLIKFLSEKLFSSKERNFRLTVECMSLSSLAGTIILSSASKSDDSSLSKLAVPLILSTASKASGVQFSALKPQKLPRHMPQENNLWRLKL